MQPDWKKLGKLSKFEQASLQKTVLWEVLGIDGRTILEYILKIQLSI
jgi:hypothetical protein